MDLKRIFSLFRRYFIFNKRLFKKPGFLAILLLVPILVFSLKAVTKQEDSGVMTVALAKQDESDPVATEIVDSLMGSSHLIRFVHCKTIQEATALVENGKADAAWIFPENMQEKLDHFTDFINQRNAVVKIIERENNVLLLLSHEKLASALFPYCSYSLYRGFIEENIILLDELPEEKLREYYDLVQAEGENIFQFSYADSDESTNDQEKNYLLTPMRGLMSILIIFGGFAVALFYMHDEAHRKFDWVRPSQRIPYAVIYHLPAIADVALAVLIALFVTGMQVSLGRELIAMILYVIISLGFCMGIRLLCKDIRLFSAIIMVLVIVMIAFCPIFFEIKMFPVIRYVLPPFYYLNAIHNIRFLFYMVIYAIGIFSLDYVLYRIKYR